MVVMEKKLLKIFGMKVDCDTNGCLQDIHWFGGDFGYFPTYSVGAFIAAQLLNEIKNTSPTSAIVILDQTKMNPIKEYFAGL